MSNAQRGPRDRSIEAGIVILITVVAAVLRLVAIDRWPPGLYHDEAFNGLDALGVLRGHLPIFFEANNGREPLFIYLQAISVALFGRSPGALRIVSALVGTFTVPAVYLAGRVLQSRRVGLLAAALAATTVWAVNLSRVGFRAVTLPLVAALALALMWRGLRYRCPWSMLGAGALFGLSLYTYLAARFGVLTLLFFIIYIALFHRGMLWPRGWALLIAAALLVAAPLGLYFAAHWEGTLGRAGQVSIASPSIHGGRPWLTLARHMVATAGLFFVRGDFIPRHNVPLRPVYDPLMGAAFVLGVSLCLRHARRDPACGLLLIWLGTFLLPTVLAEGAPHMLRASGVLPVLFVFPAIGLAAVWDELAPRLGSALAPAAIIVTLILSGALSMARYARHLQSAATYYNMEAGATQLAAEINRHLGMGWPGHGVTAPPDATPLAGRTVWLDSRLWRDWENVRYLVPESAALHILPEDGTLPPLPAGDDLLVAMWAYGDTGALWPALPPGRVITVHQGAHERGDLDAEARLLYITVRSRMPDATWQATTLADSIQPVGATWADGITLEGYGLQPVPADDTPALRVTLRWRAAGPTAADYNVFTHVICADRLIGQSDGPPAAGYYPTGRWREGDIVEEERLAPLSEAYDPATCRVVVGLYRWETLERLAIVDGAGLAVADSGLVLRGDTAVAP